MSGRQVILTPVRPFDIGMVLDLVGEDQLTGGVGTWAVLPRPRRREAVEYTGTSGLTYTLPLLLDGMEVVPGIDRSVETSCRRLLQWASEPTAQTEQPVIVTATGPLKSPPSIRWVIAGLEWGQSVRDRQGQRIQQYVTVTLREHEEAQVLRGPVAKSKKGRGKG